MDNRPAARVAVLGEPMRIYGYALAGALLCPASDRAQAARAWRGLPGDVAVVLLTPSAAHWLAGELTGRPGPLVVELPGGTPAEPAAGAAPGPVRRSVPS